MLVPAPPHRKPAGPHGDPRRTGQRAGCSRTQPLPADTNEITTLTVARVKALSQHEGDQFLDGLTTLSDGAAKALQAHDGIVLPAKFKR